MESSANGDGTMVPPGSAPRSVHESLGFLLEHRPPGLHLVLSSRSDPPLPLARLRARGQLSELRAADLRFTPGEAAALLQRGAGPPDQARPDASLTDAAVAALTARTEGWAAGLQLAALSLRGQDDVDGFVAAFTGSPRKFHRACPLSGDDRRGAARIPSSHDVWSVVAALQGRAAAATARSRRW